MADTPTASQACQNNLGEFGKFSSQTRLLHHISVSPQSQNKQSIRKRTSKGDYRGIGLLGGSERHCKSRLFVPAQEGSEDLAALLP